MGESKDGVDGSAFDGVAGYYDVLADKTGRLEREGVLLGECLGPFDGKRVVDLACGTGLHALWLAELGAVVTAMDASRAMIAYARRTREHANITYRVGDMRSVEGGPWDAAVCLGNSLSLVGSRADLGFVFMGVHESLVPGGLFFIQTLNYETPAAAESRHRVERVRKGSGELVAVKSMIPNGSTTLLSLSFFMLHEDCADTASESTVLHNHTREDLLDAALAQGFSVERCCGGFDGRPYNAESSPDIILVLGKAR